MKRRGKERKDYLCCGNFVTNANRMETSMEGIYIMERISEINSIDALEGLKQ